MRKYKKKEFVEKVGGTLTNLIWSWVTVNEVERVAYFLAWRHRIDWKKKLYPMRDVPVPEAELESEPLPVFYPHDDGRNGGAEWQSVLDRALSGELEPRLAVCKAIDENAHPKEISHIAGFYFTGHIEPDGDALWFRIDDRQEI